MTMPSVEGIRAIVLLNQFWAGFEGGRYLQAAVSFNVPVIAAAFELDLVSTEHLSATLKQ